MVHMFYNGGSLSWLRFCCIKSFKIQYPDIPLKLWSSKEWDKKQTWSSEEQQDFTGDSEETIDYLSMLEDSGVELCEWEQPDEVTQCFGILDPVHQADIFRYYILSTVGGYFSDTDILFLDDSLKDMLAKPVDTVCYYGDYPIGFIGGKGEGSIWQEVYDACLQSSTDGYQSFGAPLIKQLWFTPPRGVKNLHKHRFYYYDHYDISLLWHRDMPTDHLGQIHLYMGGALSQIYNRILTKDNYMDYPCTVTNAINEVIS